MLLNEICNYVDPLTTDAVFAAQSTTWLCSQIALAFNVAGLPAYATCEVLTKSLVLYCSSLGASPAPDAPNLAQAICVGIKSVLPKQYRFSAAIYVNGGGVYRADENTAQNVSGPFNDILFDLPIEELIRINKRKILGTWKAVLYNQKPADGSYSQVYMGSTCPNLISQETGWNYAFYSFNPYNNLTHSNEYIIKQKDRLG